MENSILIKIIVVFIIAILCYWFWICYFKKVQVPIVSSFKDKGVIAAIIIFTIFSRCTNMVNIEPNVDTSTWIASNLAINLFPDKLWTLLNYTDSRPFTVLPLYLVSLMGIEINYITTEIIGLLFWVCTGLILYKSFQLFLSRELSLLLTWLLFMVIGTTWHFDHIAYNSEHIGILAITLCMYWYLKFIRTGKLTTLKTLLLGLCLGSLPYIKFQNIPMGLVIAGFAILSLIRLKKWKTIYYLVLGGVLPTILINIYFWSVGKLSDFWVNYFWNYFYYSYSTQFQPLPVYNRFGIDRFMSFILNSPNSKLYLGGLLLSIFILGFWWFKSKKDSFDNTNFRFAIILLISSFYATLQAGNDFDHYVLYLFVPLLYLNGVLLSRLNPSIQHVFVAGILFLVMVQSVSNIVFRYPLKTLIFTELDDKIVKNIKANCPEDKSIVVWGWTDRLYYLSNRATGYRLPHSHNLFLKSELYDYRVKNFIEDMEATKPAIVIDAMIPNYSMKSEIGMRFDEYPKVSKYINDHYEFYDEIEGIKFYKRIGL